MENCVEEIYKNEKRGLLGYILKKTELSDTPRTEGILWEGSKNPKEKRGYLPSSLLPSEAWEGTTGQIPRVSPLYRTV